MYRVSGATNMLGDVSGCLSIWFWEGYEFKGTFESIICLYFIALYTNWGIWGNNGGVKGVHSSSHFLLHAYGCFWLKIHLFDL